MGAQPRMAELLAALSLATDLADGFHQEKTIRGTVLAMHLAGPDVDAVDLYYGSLLRFLGCTGFALEEARYSGGDDIALRSTFFELGAGMRSDLRTMTKGIGGVRGLAEFIRDRVPVKGHAHAQCDAGRILGRQLGASPGVLRMFDEIEERWDGNGFPRKLPGPEQSELSRTVTVAHYVEIFATRYGPARAIAEIALRSGKHLDPVICQRFLADPVSFLSLLDSGSLWDALLAAEPRPFRLVSSEETEAIAIAFGRYADLTSKYLQGHSEQVADLAGVAGAKLGLSPTVVAELRIAALLHDLGRVAVPTGVWDKVGPWTAPELAQVRSHSMHTQRILESTPLPSRIATTAGAAHERADGSGYHRGVPREALGPSAEILAASDAYAGRISDRAHRPAHPPDEVAAQMRAEAAAGLWHSDVVEAVLLAAGHAAERRAPAVPPAGLTDRETEVLRLLARGRTNKQIATELHLSAKTVSRHLENIYGKLDCHSRVGATLFAVEHKLL